LDAKSADRYGASREGNAHKLGVNLSAFIAIFKVARTAIARGGTSSEKLNSRRKILRFARQEENLAAFCRLKF